MPKRDDLSGFLDRAGRFRSWPVRPEKKRMALAALAAKFEAGRQYREREINEVLDAWHTFGDHTRLRRDLCDAGLLERKEDGSEYWRPGE